MFINQQRLTHTALEKLKKEEDTRSVTSASSKGSTEESPDEPSVSPLQLDIDTMATNIVLTSPEDDPADDSIENLLADSTTPQREQSAVLQRNSAELVMENKDNADGKGLGDVSGGEEEVATATAPDVVLENLTTECSISRPFIDLLFSTVHVKGESRLAQEVYFVIFFVLHFIS